MYLPHSTLDELSVCHTQYGHWNTMIGASFIKNEVKMDNKALCKVNADEQFSPKEEVIFFLLLNSSLVIF